MRDKRPPVIDARRRRPALFLLGALAVVLAAWLSKSAPTARCGAPA
jgi:hypothetical protein